MSEVMPELLPCLHCGGAAEFERMGTPRQSCIVRCTQCGIQLETGETWTNSGKAWNRHVPRPVVRPIVAAPGPAEGLPPHPMQPLHIVDGAVRFRENAIVRWLVDRYPGGLNNLSWKGPWPAGDYMQLTQLIGYSVDGFANLSTSSEAAVAASLAEAERLLPERRGKAPP